MEDFEVISTGVSAQPTETEGKATPKPASANADETQEESGTPAENDNAEGEESLEEGQESEEGDAQDGDKSPKKKNGFKKRIDKLNSRISEKDREIEHWKSEALKYSGKQEVQQQSSKPASSDGKPNPELFETNAEYIEALTDWKLEQKEKVSKQAAAESEIRNAQTKLQDEHNKRIQKFKETTPDFDVKVSEFIEEHGDIQLAPVVFEAIQTSDLGAEVVYEVINTPGEYERLQSMTAIQALKEIGKIEARIAAAKNSSEEKQKTIKKTTSAPAPMKPVGSNSKTEKSLEDMSFDEFMEARNAKSRGRR